MKKYIILGLLSNIIAISNTEVTILAQGGLSGFQAHNINSNSILNAGIHVSLGKVMKLKKGKLNVILGTGLEGGINKMVIFNKNNTKMAQTSDTTTTKVDYQKEIMKFHPYISPFIFAELAGEVKENIKLYTGASIGTFHYIIGNESITKFSIKAKFGTTFKDNFTSEISVGYPQYITMGLGSKFSF
ncbi:hypothetical protein [Streptobacillus moniliformis]|uniref:hypothetical protein n=1 Tax=Streptobacillus moniliformis TaxID=34105 RepID=UPI0007E3B671|nr:hypothetical protein [Streptobacillus moniliformis]